MREESLLTAHPVSGGSRAHDGPMTVWPRTMSSGSKPKPRSTSRTSCRRFISCARLSSTPVRTAEPRIPGTQ